VLAAMVFEQVLDRSQGRRVAGEGLGESGAQRFGAVEVQQVTLFLAFPAG